MRQSKEMTLTLLSKTFFNASYRIDPMKITAWKSPERSLATNSTQTISLSRTTMSPKI